MNSGGHSAAAELQAVDEAVGLLLRGRNVTLLFRTDAIARHVMRETLPTVLKARSVEATISGKFMAAQIRIAKRDGIRTLNFRSLEADPEKLIGFLGVIRLCLGSRAEWRAVENTRFEQVRLIADYLERSYNV
jgi:hypothetical protein